MEGSTEFDFESMTLAKCRFKEVIEEICEGKAWDPWISQNPTQAAIWQHFVVRVNATRMDSGRHR